LIQSITCEIDFYWCRLVVILLFQLLLMLAKSEIGRAVGVHACVYPLSVPDFGAVKMARVWAKVKRARSIYARWVALFSLAFGTGDTLWSSRWRDWEC
jgi:hypothetical protein